MVKKKKKDHGRKTSYVLRFRKPNWGEYLPFAIFALLWLGLVLVAWPAVFERFNFPKLMWWAVVGSSLAVVGFFHLIASQKEVVVVGGKYLVAFLLMFVIVTWTALDSGASWWGMYGRFYASGLSWVLSLVVFYGLYVTLRWSVRKKHMEWFHLGWVSLAIVQSFLAIAQRIWGVEYSFGDLLPEGSNTPVGTIGHPDSLAIFLLSALWWSLYKMEVNSNSFLKSLWAIGAIFLLAGLLSLGSLVALGLLAFLTIAMTLQLYINKNVGYLFSWWSGWLLFSILAVFIWSTPYLGVGSWPERYTQFRLQESWQFTLEAIERHPITGVGWENYYFSFEQEIRPELDPSFNALLNSDDNWQRVYNNTGVELLTLVSFGGLLALGVWGWFLYSLLVSYWRNRVKLLKDPEARWYAFLTVSCLLLMSFQVASMFVWACFWLGVAGSWVRLGGVSTWRLENAPELVSSWLRKPQLSLFGIVMAGFLWLVIAFGSFQWLRAERLFEKQQRIVDMIEKMEEEGTPLETEEEEMWHKIGYEAIRKAHSLVVWDERYQAALAKQMYLYGAFAVDAYDLTDQSQGQALAGNFNSWIVEAEGHIEQAIKKMPIEPGYYLIRGEIVADTEVMIDSYLKAVELAPLQPMYYYYLARQYYLNNDYEYAAQVVIEGLKTKPDWVPIRVELVKVLMEAEMYVEAQEQLAAFRLWVFEDQDSRRTYRGADLEAIIVDLESQLPEDLDYQELPNVSPPIEDRV